ncbi:DUF7289 family protein [Natrinema salinisoli]|uniref:DUF7289 family protein n=1 Tax=Natrinema salinisoli TaxID=2878535 RepID=UPI001CF01271|nr:flagellin [Natrinema salinisoli]
MDEQRAVSPLVGVILLFAIVAIGAAMVFVTGASMLDAFESDANAERAQQVMSETDHRIATVAATGTQQELPEMEGSITNDGSIEVTWYNASTGTTCTPSVTGDLRALEFELNDRTIAHQGGGVWVKTDNGVTVDSEPQIEYDGDSLRLQILQLEEGDFEGPETVARANHSKSTSLTEDINDAASDCPDATDIEVEIESSYYEGWNRYLEDAVGDSNVEAYSGNQTVEMKIANVRSPTSNPTVLIESDNGLRKTSGNDQPIEYGKTLQFNATLNNTGSKKIKPPMRVSIDGGAIVEDGNGNLQSGETNPKKAVVNKATYKNTLVPGRTYEYMIESLDDSGNVEDSLDSPGEFYLGKPGTHFNVTDSDVTTTSTGDGNVTISAEVTNRGVGEGTRDVTLELEEYNVTASEELTLDYGANGTVSWTVNESDLPIGSNAFTIDTGDDTANGTVTGKATGGEDAFVVVEDEGVGDDQVVADDKPFSVEASVVSTYSGKETRSVNLSIPGTDVHRSELITLEGGEENTISFWIDPDKYDLEPGTVYDYDISADGTGLSTPGSFYIGEPGTNFELSNGNATADDNVTVTADLKNTGVDSGSQTVTVDLEYLDEMPAELEDEAPYGTLFDGEINRSFGESDTIELNLNRSRLLDGEYRATIQTEDESATASFTVTAGVDPGRAGLEGLDNATVDISVLSSQVSGINGYPSDHELGTMTLEVLTKQEGTTTTEHVFENPSGGENINTYPSWQDKSDPVYNTTLEIKEEATLTLASSSYGLPSGTSGCNVQEEAESNYFSPVDQHRWCEEVDTSSDDYLVDQINATADSREQNLRVRTAKDNSVPGLQPGNEEQESVDEVLADVSDPVIDRDSLWNDGELTLDENEFIFLFEATTQCGMYDSGCAESNDDIDALWDSARDNTGSGDPNFNDLIVYVSVERANVDPGTPSITITPGGGGSTDVDAGDGRTAGRVDEIDARFEGDTDEGSAPDLGTGDSTTTDGTSGTSSNTGIEIDTDHVVIG